MSNESEQTSFIRGTNGELLTGNETDNERAAYYAGQSHQQTVDSIGSSSGTTGGDGFSGTTPSQGGTARSGLFWESLNKLMRMYGGCTTIPGYLGVLVIFIEAALIFFFVPGLLKPRFGVNAWYISFFIAAAFMTGFKFRVTQAITAILGAAAYPAYFLYGLIHNPNVTSLGALAKTIVTSPSRILLFLAFTLLPFAVCLLAFWGAIREIEMRKKK